MKNNKKANNFYISAIAEDIYSKEFMERHAGIYEKFKERKETIKEFLKVSGISIIKY